MLYVIEFCMIEKFPKGGGGAEKIFPFKRGGAGKNFLKEEGMKKGGLRKRGTPDPTVTMKCTP